MNILPNLDGTPINGRALRDCEKSPNQIATRNSSLSSHYYRKTSTSSLPFPTKQLTKIHLSPGSTINNPSCRRTVPLRRHICRKKDSPVSNSGTRTMVSSTCYPPKPPHPPPLSNPSTCSSGAKAKPAARKLSSTIHSGPPRCTQRSLLRITTATYFS